MGQGLLVRDGAVLLCANQWYRDKAPVWTLPGGRAEQGEGISEALSREFIEETGLAVQVEELAYVIEARSLTVRRLFLTCVFTVNALSGELSCEADPSVVELRFVPFGELQLYLPSPSLSAPLLEFLRAPNSAARYWYFPEYS